MSQSQASQYSLSPIMPASFRSAPAPPFTKRTKSSMKKKPLAKKKGLAIVRSPFRTALPPMFRNTMRYAELITATTNSSGYQVSTFRANSIYDPNYGGAGHQVHYWDKLHVLYDKWAVLGSKIKVTPQFSSASTDCTYTYTIFTDDDGVLSVATATDAFEREGAVTKVVYAEGGIPSVNYSWSSFKEFGVSPVGVEPYQGSSFTPYVPTELIAYGIQMNADATINYTFLVQIEYDVVWSEIATVAQSA